MSEIPEDIARAAREAYFAPFRETLDSAPVNEVILSVARAILAERERHGWQQIETAPRDGTVVDFLTKEGLRFTEEWWIEDEGGFWSCDFADDTFTHWMPLPQSPKKRRATEETAP
jgi:hypothetical protein